MPHDVFISYATEDKRVADAACAALEARGIRCWMAPRDVVPGTLYGAAIVDAIQAARVMVVVFSAHANASQHIPNEVERALANGLKIIPFRIADVAPGRSLDYFLSPLHWLDAVTPPLEPHLQTLSRVVGDTLGATASATAHATTAATVPSEARIPPPDPRPSGQPPPRSPARRWVIGAGALILLLAEGGAYFHTRATPKLTDKDSVILAAFNNTTGDPVFDGTLREGLSVQLEQSPFLNLVPDDEIASTLRLMEQPPDAKLTGDLARQVCERTGSAAMISGSIATLAPQYVIGLRAVGCKSGRVLAEEQATAATKPDVLKALSSAAADLRGKLGESLGSVEKEDVPLEQATTGSLEALQSLTLGEQAISRTDFFGAIPYLQRAIELDPNFATAYFSLGAMYWDLGENQLTAENIKKAYELKDRASERERMGISAYYDAMVTGDYEKVSQVAGIWANAYPRDVAAANTLGLNYLALGQTEKACEGFEEAVRRRPVAGINNDNLAFCYASLGQLDEARTTIKRIPAGSKNLAAYLVQYLIDFLQNDPVGMRQDLAATAGAPGIEDLGLFYDANAEAYSGHLADARKALQSAVEVAGRYKLTEMAAGYRAQFADVEGLLGNADEAKRLATQASAVPSGLEVQSPAAFALALAGSTAESQRLADDLNRSFPDSTVVQHWYLPAVRAALALPGDARQAIESLGAAAPYELGSSYGYRFTLTPAYLRGNAYLAAHDGASAVAEFQKIIDHRALVNVNPVGALAHLGLGRAYALQGDNAKARAAYQDFLTLWKDADPDVPILKQAKAEFANLH